MIFDPHSQIQEEPSTRNSHTSHPSIPNSNQLLHPPSQAHLSDDFMNSETKKSNQESPNSHTMCSYDIYGNEMSLEDENLDKMLEPREMDLERIEEEEIMSPDTIPVNQENNDPVLHMITPLKKRGERRGVAERRRSFAINRNPLIDITPVSRRRKCSHHLELRIEGSLLNGSTPRDDQKKNEGDVMFTRKLR